LKIPVDPLKNYSQRHDDRLDSHKYQFRFHSMILGYPNLASRRGGFVLAQCRRNDLASRRLTKVSVGRFGVTPFNNNLLAREACCIAWVDNNFRMIK
jgi:hypothetical protein